MARLIFVIIFALICNFAKADESVWTGEVWDTGSGILFSNLVPSGTIYRIALGIRLGVTMEDGETITGAAANYSTNLLRVGGAEEYDACTPEYATSPSTGPLKKGDSLTLSDAQSGSMVYLTIEEIQPTPWDVGVRVSYLLLANLPACTDTQEVTLCIFEDDEPADGFEDARLVKSGKDDLRPTSLSAACPSWTFEGFDYPMPYGIIYSGLTTHPVTIKACLELNGYRDTVNPAFLQVNTMLAHEKTRIRTGGGQRLNGKYFKFKKVIDIFNESDPTDVEYAPVDDYFGNDIYPFSIAMIRGDDNCYVLPLDNMLFPRNITGLYSIKIDVRQ